MNTETTWALCRICDIPMRIDFQGDEIVAIYKVCKCDSIKWPEVCE